MPRDANHRLIQAGPLARRAAAWLGEPVLVKDEIARFASCGDHIHGVTLRASRADGVAEIIFDVTSRHPELAGERRNGSRLLREQIDQMPTNGHPNIMGR